MLRLLVVLLLLANGTYYAWSRGHLAVVGLAPVPQTEPARMRAQIKPELVRVLRPADARPQELAALGPTATATAAAPNPVAAKPSECLQSALLTDKLAQSVRRAAEVLPTGTWLIEPVEESGRWIVYMGKYAAADVMAKKRAELRQLDVSIEPLQNPTLEPGISLGGYPTQAEATKELADLNKRGVRTAKVVQEKPPIQGQVLRLPAVDEALRGQLDGVRTALGNATLRACKAS
jgi:hypothetical protein